MEVNNDTAPHKAVINIYAEVYEVLPERSECKGAAQFKKKILVALDGKDKATTVQKLNELLQEIRQKCQS